MIWVGIFIGLIIGWFCGVIFVYAMAKEALSKYDHASARWIAGTNEYKKAKQKWEECVASEERQSQAFKAVMAKLQEIELRYGVEPPMISLEEKDEQVG